MAKASKQTKKFSKNHLKDHIERRKKQAKVAKQFAKKPQKVVEAVETVQVSDSEQQSSQSVSDSENQALHQEELEQLKQKDPEFFQFLQENDPVLLDFQDQQGGEADNLGSEEESIAEEPAGVEDEQLLDLVSEIGDQQDQGLTSAQVAKWTASINNGSIKVANQFLHVFRNLMDSSSEGDALVLSEENTLSSMIRLVVSDVPTAICNSLGLDVKLKTASFKQITALKAYRKCQSVIKQLVACVELLVSQTSDKSMQQFVFVSLTQAHAPLLFASLGLNKVTKDLLKQAVEVSCDVKSAKENPDDVTAINKELEIRTASTVFIKDWIGFTNQETKEWILKRLYTEYLLSSKLCGVHTLASLQFLCDSLVEIVHSHGDTTYTLGFQSIRQLAMLLRNAIGKPSTENTLQVMSWQFLWSVRFWVAVILRVRQLPCGESNKMIQLLYPLLQVVFGVIRLSSSKVYHPMQLHLLDTVAPLSSPTSLSIPVMNSTLAVLHSLVSTVCSQGSSMKAVKGVKPIQLEHTLRLSPAYPITPVNYQPMLSKSLDIIEQDIMRWSYFVGFPEYANGCQSGLRRIKKLMEGSRSSMDGSKKRVISLMKSIEENTQWILPQRDSLSYGPLDILNKRGSSEVSRDTMSPLEKYIKAVERVRSQV